MKWLNIYDVQVQTAIISAAVSAAVSLILFLINWMKDSYMLNHKLKKEYVFKQRKGIKEKLAQSKTHLIKATEDLNHRLWNFSENIGKKWHCVNFQNPDWLDIGSRYYIKSFVYRFLTFLHYVEVAENDIYDFDFSAASKSEKLYLKYIKVLRFFFCDASILKDLNYNDSSEKAHLYNNKIHDYVGYIMENGNIISYDRFIQKVNEDYMPIQPIFKMISDIKDDKTNCNHNIWCSFHLFIMVFLNKYGLDYQYTPRKKFQGLINKNKYCEKITIKNSLLHFFRKNKIMGEIRWILEDLYSKPKWLPIPIWNIIKYRG